jgi:uncharacterized membrane protein YebE (DUF533 family)
MDKTDKTIGQRIAGYILIGVAAYSAYWAWQTSAGSEDQFSQGQMPPCDSSPVRHLQGSW